MAVTVSRQTTDHSSANADMALEEIAANLVCDFYLLVILVCSTWVLHLSTVAYFVMHVS